MSSEFSEKDYSSKMIKSIVQNIDNNNGGGMKKQGGPVTTGNTHTYWRPTLTRTIIKGKSTGNDGSTSWKNYGKTYSDNMYRPFNIFRSGTGAKFRFQYP